MGCMYLNARTKELRLILEEMGLGTNFIGFTDDLSGEYGLYISFLGTKVLKMLSDLPEEITMEIVTIDDDATKQRTLMTFKVQDNFYKPEFSEFLDIGIKKFVEYFSEYDKDAVLFVLQLLELGELRHQ